MIHRVFVAVGLCSLLGACSSQAEDGDTQAQASTKPQGVLGCPTALVQQNITATRGAGFWNVDETECFSIGKSTFPAPVNFEFYLAKHPHSSLGLPKGNEVAQCFQNYLRDNNSTAQRFYALPSGKQDYAERATISDYYFTMNTMRQATRGALEALAALDFLVGSTPILSDKPRDADDATYPVKYSSPLAVDSESWLAQLRACDPPAESPMAKVLVETRDHLTMMTYIRVMQALIDYDVELIGPVTNDVSSLPNSLPKIWYKQWKDESKLVHIGQLVRLKGEFKADRDALSAQYNGHKAAAPWLQGKRMTSLLDYESLLGVRFYEYTEGGSYATADLTGLRSKTPEEVMQWVASKIDARMNAPIDRSIFVLLRQQVKENRKLLADKLGRVYEAAECMHRSGSSSCTSVVNEVMETWPIFDGSGFRSDQLPEDREVMQRLLDSDDPKKKELGNRLLEKQTKANASVAGMFAAECRSTVRQSNEKIDELKSSLAQGIVITIATAGLGSWLTASKAALAAAEGAKAASLAVRVQALNGILLAADGYWLGDGIVTAMKACDKYVNQNLQNVGVTPLGTTKPYCRTGQEALGGNDLSTALAPTAVSDYRACALEASLNVGLNTIGVIPSAVGFRNSFKTLPK
ncbi:MAG: hypothetical protein U0169_01100 [Polyangiaceae bacterium]